jgi:hypothetical protein
LRINGTWERYDDTFSISAKLNMSSLLQMLFALLVLGTCKIKVESCDAKLVPEFVAI